MEQNFKLWDNTEKRIIEVTAKKIGQEWVGFCCFHNDTKTPNLFINEEKEVYLCRACGAKGRLYIEGNQYNKGKRKVQKTDEERKRILASLTIDLANWESYPEEVKKEVLTELPLNLCFLEEGTERDIAIDALDKAGIIRKAETKRRIKKILSLLKKTEVIEKEERISKQKFNPRVYSDKILEKYPLRSDTIKRFWIYHKKRGLWIERAEPILNSLLRKTILGEKDYKAYCVREIFEDLKGLSLKIEDPVEPELYLIPFNNKIYDIKNKKEIEFSPEYFLINKLAVDYNPQVSEFPTIRKIFKEIVGEENIVTLLEIVAYCMWRGYPYPKAFILFGSGANGKTAFIKILRRILGNKNISSETSNAIQYNPFSMGRLYGKLANVTSEMEYNILKNTVKLKMATGEDLMNCERKFKEPFLFVNYAKLIFLTNQIPLTTDKTFAFYRRIFLLEFPNKFILGENADPDIVDRINQREFEGLALWALAKLGELKKKYFVFTKHKRTEEITEQYENLSNPLFKFINDFTIKEPNSDIPKSEFQSKFEAYQRDKGFRIWSDKEISREMRGMGFIEKSLTRGELGNKRTFRAWIEIFWK